MADPLSARCGFAGRPINGTFEVTAFEQFHKDRDLRWACRSDNGVPFASPNAPFNLPKLSVWGLGSASPSSGPLSGRVLKRKSS